MHSAVLKGFDSALPEDIARTEETVVALWMEMFLGN